MTGSSLSDLTAAIAETGHIAAADVLALRRVIYGDVAISPAEADALIALDEEVPARCPEWDDLFCEALTDYVVRQQEPADYIDEAKADWLMSRLTADGRIKTDSELELLVHMLEAATTAPARLTAFALSQVKAAVVGGDGPLLRAGRLEQGRVSAGEVALLRRILYAAGGDGNVAITRAEAEALFDINDACRDADNDPAWTDLFAKAVAASVMTVSGFVPVSREDEARREAWLAQAGPGPLGALGGFMGRMFSSAPDLKGWRDDGLGDWRALNARTEALESAAESVSEDEARWLADRIGRDGRFDDAEKAVIQFLKRESRDIHPALKPLLDAA
jgi:hypothetical protein